MQITNLLKIKKSLKNHEREKKNMKEEKDFHKPDTTWICNKKRCQRFKS